MSLSDIFGTSLSAAFAVGGERLTSLYALSGEKLWTAESAVYGRCDSGADYTKGSEAV